MFKTYADNEEIIRDIKNGIDVDKNFRILVKANEKLISMLTAKLYYPFKFKISKKDTRHNVLVAMWETIQKYDVDSGIKFVTYFYHCYMSEQFKDLALNTKFTLHEYPVYGKIRKLMDEGKYNRNMSMEEKVKACGYKDDVYARGRIKAVEKKMQIIFVHIDGKHKSEKPSIKDLPISETIGGEDINLTSVENKYITDELLSILNEKEKYMVMNHINGCSQTEIGKELGISQVQATRLYNKALDKMRDYGRKELGLDVPEKTKRTRRGRPKKNN